MAKWVKIQDSYEVEHDRVVRLSVFIGQAQVGVSLVKLDGVEIGRGDIDLLPIGPGRVIVGKSLAIRTVVTDVNFSTNRTSVMYSFTGGPQPKDIYRDFTSDADHDTVIYEATIALK